MAMSLLCFLVLAATVPQFGVTWDELIYHEGARSCSSWMVAIALKALGSSEAHPLSKRALEVVWNPYYHPPLAKIVYALSWGLLHRVVGDLFAMRLGACFMAALIPGLLTYFLWPRIGPIPSILAALGYALSPRIFADSHFVCVDIPSALTWLLAVLCFGRLHGTRRGLALAGVAFALAIATKLTGFFLPFSLLAWTLWIGRPERVPEMLWAVLLGFGLFLAFWPYLWPAPVANMISYLKLYLTKKQIATTYLGTCYADSPPGWHYPFVMTLATMPPWMSLLGLYGAILALLRGRKTPFLSLLLFAGITPLLVVALPGTPKYDGIRLFHSGFPLLAGLAGVGFKDLFDRCRHIRLLRPLTSRPGGLILVGALLGSQAWAIRSTHPFELSYYSPLVAGVRGARSLGFETTYWGDAFSPRFLRTLNDVLPVGAKVKFLPIDERVGNASIETLNAVPHAIRYYWDTGALRRDIQPYSAPPYDFAILHARQGFFDEFCWELYRDVKPICEERLQGILLAAVYDLRSLPAPARSLQPWASSSGDLGSKSRMGALGIEPRFAD